MADAFQGGFGTSVRSRDHGIVLKLPDIPLWAPQKAQRVLEGLIYSTVRLALQEVAGRVSDQAGQFQDTGHLAQSFGADPATSTGGIEMSGARGDGNRDGRRTGSDIQGRVFSSLPYAVVMEDGRRPGRPISRSGIDAIGLWAQRKLGLSAEQADRAKWAIAMHIIAQGIEGKGYFSAGVQAARPRVESMFTILGDQLALALLKPGTGQTGTL